MVGRMLYEEEIMADLGSKYYRIPVSALTSYVSVRVEAIL